MDARCAPNAARRGKSAYDRPSYCEPMVRWVLKKWPIKIRDDRGRETPLINPPRWPRGSRKGWWQPQYVGTHSGLRLEAQLRNDAVFPYGLAPVIVFFVTLHFSKYLVPFYGWQGEIIRGAIVLAISIPFSFYNLRSHRARASPELVRSYLASNRCPSCDYDLSAQVAAADECKVCSECGAAWRMASPPAEVQSTPA